MKKLLYSAVAFATLLTAACQQENLEPVVTGENTVTYTVQVPQSMKTKAIGDELAGKFLLTYEVYRADDVDDLINGSSFYENNTPIEFDANGVATLSLQFVKDQDYVVLFWANTEESADLYNTTDLRKVSINNAWTANDVNAAAFSGIDTVSDCVSAKKGAVSLVRPVSQINIATSEESLNLRGNVITLGQSSVTVNGLFGVYNVYDKTVSVENTEVAYGVANVPAGEFGTVGNTTYNYVAMSYVGFAPETGTTVDVDFTFSTNEGDINHSVPNVPIKPNYRTNILGNLISEEHAYTVTLDTDWADNGGNMEFVTDGLVKNLNGDYEVSTEKGLAYAMNTLFAQGGDFYLTKEIYDLSGFAVTPPTVPSGVTLNIYGETPVVTRAATTLTGITIIGLDSFIDEINSGAQVSISGVTVQNEESATVTLVEKVAEGAAVVISDCAVVNSSEGSDKIEDLIGEGAEKVVNAAEVTTLAELQTALASGVEEIQISEPLVITGEATINLNVKTVKAIDETTGSYGMITNKGTLVINGEGTLQLSAVNDRGWSAYSSVISNQVGGHLTVNKDVVIEHLGGTSMAYGIDNLTNGKGTSAVVVVNGATVKSTYRAIRQFLNGVEANNELYIKKDSKIEGANKGVWMQDPSKNANSGKLIIENGANAGVVYLDVTEGSTEWPVEVSIAKSAVSNFITENVPAGYYIVEVANAYTVIKMAEINTAEALLEALENGSNVKFASDITIDPASLSNAYGKTGINILHGQTIDGNGHVLNIRGANGTWDSGINTTGGLIKNLTITGSFRGLFVNHNSTHSEKVILEDVIIDGTIYTISCDQATNQGLEARNSTFNGWTSYAGTLGAAKFINCTFGEGNGYAFFRPYAATSFVNCNFEAGYELDPCAAVTFENCTLDGVALSKNNLTTLVTSNINNVKAYASDLASLEAAIDLGISSVILENTITLEAGNTTLDLAGVKIEAPVVDAFTVKSGAKLTLKNAEITSHGAVVRAVGGEIVIENGKFTQTGTALASPSTYRYAIDCREGGKITINGGEFVSGNGMINVSSEVIINGGKFTNTVEKVMTRHFAYVSAPLTINGGEFCGKANSSAGGCFFCGASAGCDIQINGGKFTSLWTSGSVNGIFEVYYGGTINVTGGMFNTNRGITNFVTANTDDTTKATYPYVAK